MKNKQRGNMVIWVVIVILFIGMLIVINRKDVSTDVVGDSLPVISVDVVENKNMQNVQKIEGLEFTISKEGTGTVTKTGDTVVMNYTGKLADGTVFDSNVDPKFNHVQPFVFTIGGGQVIKGWDVGIAGMKVGEKRTLLIQPDYAYGANGYPGVIPPNAVLSFDVELVAIKN